MKPKLFARQHDDVGSLLQSETETVHVAQQHDELRDGLGVEVELGAASGAGGEGTTRILLPPVQPGSLQPVSGLTTGGWGGIGGAWGWNWVLS